MGITQQQTIIKLSSSPDLFITRELVSSFYVQQSWHFESTAVAVYYPNRALI